MARPPLHSNEDLAALARSIAAAKSNDRLALRIDVRENETGYRLRAKQLAVTQRTADSVAKFGGGSLLTTTIALLLGGQSGSLVIGVAALTLLSFLIGTMLSAVYDRRSTIWEHEAERLRAVLIETEE